MKIAKLRVIILLIMMLMVVSVPIFAAPAGGGTPSPAADVTFSIDAPASTSAGSIVNVKINAETTKIMYAGSFVIKSDKPVTYGAAVFVTGAAPESSCTVSGNDNACSITWDDGLNGGVTTVLTIPITISETSTLSLGGVEASSDMGTIIAVASGTKTISVASACTPTCTLASKVTCGSTNTEADGCGGSCSVAGTQCASGTCTNGVCVVAGAGSAGATTVGEHLNEKLGAAKSSKTWTLELISQIAVALSSWFTS